MIGGTTAALVVVPILIDLAMTTPGGGFAYVAADAFYYLTVAQNFATDASISFDQSHPTNGFHPLWQAILSQAALVLLRFDGGQEMLIDTSVVLGAGLIGAGILFLAQAIAHRSKRISALFVLVPFGIYAAVLTPLWLEEDLEAANSMVGGSMPLYGTLWSYANGMESGAVLLFFGLSALVCCKGVHLRSLRGGAIVGLILALLALSRLDHIFISLFVIGMCAVEGLRRKQWKGVVVLSLTFGAVIGGYLLLNELLVGSALPTSGAVKSKFPDGTDNNLEHLQRSRTSTLCVDTSLCCGRGLRSVRRVSIVTQARRA
ncbi:MAG: hypothetical protein AAGF12_24845 [Myxococcota bacterium]